MRLPVPLHLRGRRWRALIAAALIGATLAGCATLDTAQRRWIFQASKLASDAHPALPARVEEVWIPVPGTDERIHGWWQAQPRRTGIPATDAPDTQVLANDAPAMLYLHGARRTVESSAHRTRRLVEAGFDVLSIDYRGFGRSDGELPSEAMSYADAQAAWAWLAAKVPATTPRIVYGHSIGGAVAIDLAAREQDVAALAVESTFTSLPELFATLRYGWLPVGFLITQRFESIDKIGQIEAPKLIIHGTRDRLVPHTMSDRLFAAASEPRTLLKIEGGTHGGSVVTGFASFSAALDRLAIQARERHARVQARAQARVPARAMVMRPEADELARAVPDAAATRLR